MYKMQMTVQKVICTLTLIASAVVFLYSLGLMTDLYGNLYTAMTVDSSNVLAVHPDAVGYNEGYDLYEKAQPFNHQLLVASLILIGLSCVLLITNTGSRRRYYIGNYFAVALNVPVQVGVSVWAHMNVEALKAQYQLIDMEVLKTAVELAGQQFSGTNFWFDVHYFVFGLVLLMAVLLILNVIWKIILMKEEKKLIKEGKAVSA